MDVLTQNSTASPLGKIWRHFPMRNASSDPRWGVRHHEDFGLFPTITTNTTGNIKDWRVFASDGATAVDAAVANVSAITIASDGDNEGMIFTHTSAPIRITKNSTAEVAFGCRFKTSTIADTKHGFIFGLWASLAPTATSHIAANGTLADTNFIGFHRLEGDGDKLDIVYKADGQTQQSFADSLTLVADTWYNAEFYFDGYRKLSFYFDGAEYTTAELGSTELAAATFPSDVNLTPTFGMLNATASTPGSLTVDWVDFGYKYPDGA